MRQRADLVAGALILALLVPLDVLANGHPGVQATASICGAVAYIARMVATRF